MNDNNCTRRFYMQTLNYHSEDASHLANNFKSSLRFSLQSEELDESDEPMDVDLDEFTVTNTNIYTSNDVDSLNLSKENYFLRNEYIYPNNELNFCPNKELSLEDDNLKCLVKKEEPFKKYSKSLLVVLVVLFGIVYYSFVNFYSGINNTNILQNVAEELEARVRCQDEAVQLILRNFQCVNTSDECRRILPFVGSTGVGKTFIGNIIKKHFPEKCVNEVNSVKLNKMQEREFIKSTINRLVCNLIIMDDLKFKDINSVLNFINALPNVRCLLVIPIFNIQETSDNIAHKINFDDFENISGKFRDSTFKYEVILFNIINKDVVEEWIKELLISKNFDKKHFSVIKNVLEHQDVRHYGFKGIEAKLNLFLHQFSKR